MLKPMTDSFEEESDTDDPIITKDIVVHSKVQLDHLVCPICLNVIWQPVTCASVGCYSSFCEGCIVIWLGKQLMAAEETAVQRGCPKCKKPFRRISMPLLKGLLESLTVRCLYYRNGCTDQLGYSELQRHMERCTFKRVRCPGCSDLFHSRDYEQHVTVCEQLPIECEKCGLTLVRAQFRDYHSPTVCYSRQLSNHSSRVAILNADVDDMNSRLTELEHLTQRLIRSQTLPLRIQFHTTFTQHFTFPTVTLVKPSFNIQKEKFDFLHFYLVNPLRCNSPLSVGWRMRIYKLTGNLLIGFCSSMCTSSLDYVINKFGELKKKEPNQSKYRPVRKTFFEFGAGDEIQFHFNSFAQQLKIENLSRNLSMRLEQKEIQEMGPCIYNFYSMDTLNDSVVFAS